MEMDAYIGIWEATDEKTMLLQGMFIFLYTISMFLNWMLCIGRNSLYYFILMATYLLFKLFLQPVLPWNVQIVAVGIHFHSRSDGLTY